MLRNLLILCCFFSLNSCVFRHEIGRTTLDDSFSECTAIIITSGNSVRVDLLPVDSVFINTVAFFKNKGNYIGTTNTNERSRDMFKMWLFKNDSLLVDLAVLDNEAGMLIYKGNTKFGQNMLVYKNTLLPALQAKIDSVRSK